MKIFVTLSLLASAAVGVLAADELKIDVTLPVECERKTQSGDKVSMHYKGTLENGNKFDASMLQRYFGWMEMVAKTLLPPTSLGPPRLPDNFTNAFILSCLGYDRGTPFSFKLGSGQVIKGFVENTALPALENAGSIVWF